MRHMVPSEDQEFVFRESHSHQSSWRRYRFDGRTVRRTGERKQRSWLESWGNVAKEAFLPQGYPESVSSDYLSYQLWDTLQAFCSSITGTLATLAVLKGVGVGDSTATPLAATITWMLRETYYYRTSLDCFSKQWRLVADALNDLAILLDLVAPLFPSVFLLIACFASLSRAVVGVAGRATRAAFIQHQARRNNMADVAAKDGSQETLMNLVGLIVNLIITPTVASSQSLVWLMFVVFTALHLWANYCAVTVICIETLNKNRLHIVVKHYLKTGVLLSPKEANALEPVLRRVPMSLSYSLGSPLSEALQSSAGDYIRSANYLIILHRTESKVSICLREGSERRDQLRAALVLEYADYIHTAGVTGPVLAREYTTPHTTGKGSAVTFNALKVAQSMMEKSCEQLLSELSAIGWVTSHVLLGTDEWRYSWAQDKNT